MRLRPFAGLLALVPGVAFAAPSCPVPATLDVPKPDGPSASQPTRIVPITRYTLALIWTPEQCRAGVRGAESFRCAPGDATHGFTLHGLWPDGDGGTWPQYCRPAAILRPSVIRAHHCATPSPQLLQHEWAKHGTCMPGYAPRRFFALSNRLYRQIRMPDMARLAARTDLAAADVAGAFAAVNQDLPADAMRLNVSRDGWMAEVWICLDTRFRAERCPAGQGGTSGSRPVRVAPPG